MSTGIVMFTHVHRRVTNNGSMLTTMGRNCGGTLSTVLSKRIAAFVTTLILVILNSNAMGNFTCALVVSVVLSLFATLFVTGCLAETFCNINIETRGFCNGTGGEGIVEFMRGEIGCFIVSNMIVLTNVNNVVCFNTADNGTLGCDLRFMNNASAATSFNGSCATTRIRGSVIPSMSGLLNGDTIRIAAMRNDRSIALGAHALSLSRERSLTTLLRGSFGISTSAVRARDVDSAVDKRVEAGTMGTIVVSYVFVLLCV